MRVGRDELAADEKIQTKNKIMGSIIDHFQFLPIGRFK